MSELMTRNERNELMKLVRMRARVSKANVDRLVAERMAEVESQLAETHRADAEHWKHITQDAQDAVKQADAAITRVCEERGIPENLRPELSLSWWGRGESASASRRAELRKVAYARLDGARKAGMERIEAWTADRLTDLVSDGLTTDAARAFLDTLPQPETLVPAVELQAQLTDGGDR